MLSIFPQKKKKKDLICLYLLEQNEPSKAREKGSTKKLDIKIIIQQKKIMTYNAGIEP